MTADDSDWLRHGEGQRPRPVWSFATQAPLAALEFARETGEVLAADTSGGLYLLDRHGTMLGQARGPTSIRALAWGETGGGGVALVGEEKLYWFDRRLVFQGWIEQTVPVLSIAADAHGQYVAVGLASGDNVLYDAHRKLVRRFSSSQPLGNIRFLIHEPALVAATEYGLLCCHDFTGELQWQEKLFSGIGDLAITGDGQSILLACFAHGIQRHNGHGVQEGSYQLGGTVSKVAADYSAGHIAAATQERQFHYLDGDGEVIWQAALPGEVLRVACDPQGKGVICALRSGRIHRFDWERG
jgi:outer membrane protein assembly factor BamB